MIKNKNMIKSVNTCLNCENLVDSLLCSKHDLSVEIDNVCSDHTIKKAFSKLSDCLSCSSYKKASCANPGHSAPGMLCFSWSSY